ncbi:MAG: hypothetical protein U9N04_02055 [Patescibacteria group bacterium]|nr:hypothetical protein [Patescibacteria group bacterium]
MKEEVLLNNNSERKSLFDWLKDFKQEVKEIFDDGELTDAVEANINANLLDDNILNMIAVVIDVKVKKGEIEKRKAIDVFVAIKNRIDEYNSLYRKEEINYNELNFDFRYLLGNNDDLNNSV